MNVGQRSEKKADDDGRPTEEEGKCYVTRFRKIYKYTGEGKEMRA